MALFVSKALAELDTPVDSSGRETFGKHLLSNLSMQKSKSEEFVVGLGAIGEGRPSKTKSLSPKSWQSSLKTFSLSTPTRSSSIPLFALNRRGSLESSSYTASELKRSSSSGSTERGLCESRERGLCESRERGLSESSGRSSLASMSRSSSESSGRSSLASMSRSSSESRGRSLHGSKGSGSPESKGSISSELKGGSSPESKDSGYVQPRKIKSFNDVDLNLQCDERFLSQHVSEIFYSSPDQVEKKPIEHDIKIMYGSRNILDLVSNIGSPLVINHPPMNTISDYSYFNNNYPIKEEKCPFCDMQFNPPIDYAAIVTFD